jgi:SAM-dependent methyltransferase
VATPAPNPRDERFARAIDREVAPYWHNRFARLLYRHLPELPPDGLALEVHCGPGHTAAGILGRTPPGLRMVALEPQEPLRAIAKSNLISFGARVWVKPGELADVTQMPVDTYDLVIANVVLGDAPDLAAALRELLRVTKPGGSLLVTLPMEGTWTEAEDLFREVLRGHGLRDAARRLRALARLRPTGQELARLLGEVGVGPHHYVLEQDRFSLLFRGGREFLFSPVVELGPLRLWKAILGDHQAPQELFWQLKESIDTYFADAVFAVSAVAGVMHVCKASAGPAGARAAVQMAGAYWARYPELDALFQQAERGSFAVEEDEYEIDLAADEPASESMAAPGPGEEDAFMALLEQPLHDKGESELDALLDQVLEFARNEPELAPDGYDPGDLIPEELRTVAPMSEPERAPGDTLSRIRALLPPPPRTGPHPDLAEEEVDAEPDDPGRPPPPPPPGGRIRRDRKP